MEVVCDFFLALELLILGVEAFFGRQGFHTQCAAYLVGNAFAFDLGLFGLDLGLLQLDNRVFLGSGVLLSLSFGEVFLENLVGSVCDQLGKLALDLWREFLTIVGHRHTKLLLYFSAILEGDVFLDVCRTSRRYGLRRRRLSHNGLYLRVFGCGHVDLNMGLMLLMNMRLDRFAGHNRHVLGDRVHGLHVVFERDDLLSVGVVHRLQHSSVEELEVINMGRSSC